MNRNRQSGFTMVELVVVIAVLSVLISIIYFLIASWRVDAAETQVKNELTQATNAVTNSRNFSGTYPTSGGFSTVYEVGPDVTFDYVYRAGDDSFCMEAQSQRVATVRYHVDSRTSTTPVAGVC